MVLFKYLPNQRDISCLNEQSDNENNQFYFRISEWNKDIPINGVEEDNEVWSDI